MHHRVLGFFVVLSISVVAWVSGYLTTGVLALSGLFALVLGLAAGSRPLVPRGMIVFLAYVTLVDLVTSIDIDTLAKNMARASAFLAVYVGFAVTRPRDADRILWGMVGVMGGEAALAVYQVGFGPHIPRALGTLANPNVLAFMLSLTLASLLELRPRYHGAWAALMLAGVVATQSRTGLIAAMAVVGLAAVARRDQGSVLVALGVVSVLFVVFEPWRYEAVAADGLFAQTSWRARMDIFREALTSPLLVDASLPNRLFGYGRDVIDRSLVGALSDLDNEFLRSLVGYGTVGVALMCVALGEIGIIGLRTWRRKGQGLGMAVAVASLLVTMITAESLSSLYVGPWFLMSVSLMCARQRSPYAGPVSDPGDLPARPPWHLVSRPPRAARYGPAAK